MRTMRFCVNNPPKRRPQAAGASPSTPAAAPGPPAPTPPPRNPTLLEFLSQRCPHHKAERWSEIIQHEGWVYLNGVVCRDPHRILVTRDELGLNVPAELEPEVDSAVRVVYADADIALVAKSGNMPVAEGGRYCKRTLVAMLPQLILDKAAQYGIANDGTSSSASGNPQKGSASSCHPVHGDEADTKEAQWIKVILSTATAAAAVAAHPGTESASNPPPVPPLVFHPAHRLDKETSGLVLLARSSAAASLLGRMFQAKTAGAEVIAAAGQHKQTDAAPLPHHQRQKKVGASETEVAEDLTKEYVAVLTGRVPQVLDIRYPMAAESAWFQALGEARRRQRDEDHPFLDADDEATRVGAASTEAKAAPTHRAPNLNSDRPQVCRNAEIALGDPGKVEAPRVTQAECENADLDEVATSCLPLLPQPVVVLPAPRKLVQVRMVCLPDARLLRPGCSDAVDAAAGATPAAPTADENQPSASTTPVKDTATATTTSTGAATTTTTTTTSATTDRWTDSALLRAAAQCQRPARTVVTPIRYGRGATLCRIRLYTGRTHQIRLHCAAAGFPVVGDKLYTRGGGSVDCDTYISRARGEAGFEMPFPSAAFADTTVSTETGAGTAAVRGTAPAGGSLAAAVPLAAASPAASPAAYGAAASATTADGGAFIVPRHLLHAETLTVPEAALHIGARLRGPGGVADLGDDVAPGCPEDGAEGDRARRFSHPAWGEFCRECPWLMKVFCDPAVTPQ